MRYGGDPSQAYPALCELVRTLCERWSIKPAQGERRYEILVRTARQALHEWYWPTCRVCRGAREFVVGDRRVDCPTCEATGVHRYEDYERRMALMDGEHSEEEWDTWSRRLTEALDVVRASDAAVAGEMHYQLRTDD